jgi:putative beta-lysine N-acetyltransferase
MTKTLEFADHVRVLADYRNRRLIINDYPLAVRPQELALKLINVAEENSLSKIWLWAKPADVPAFLQSGFSLEGHLFQGDYDDFVVSLAYFPKSERSWSFNIAMEDDILNFIKVTPLAFRTFLPRGMSLSILNETQAKEISRLMTRVFSSYPTPMEDQQYVSSLMQKGCIFAGAHYQGNLISVAAAYPDKDLGRCELTDCATLAEHRGYSLTEKLLEILEEEIAGGGSFILYTLARAQSMAMNRVFYKLGYQYRGRLINNCHISGSFQDMNLWVKTKK